MPQPHSLWQEAWGHPSPHVLPPPLLPGRLCFLVSFLGPCTPPATPQRPERTSYDADSQPQSCSSASGPSEATPVPKGASSNSVALQTPGPHLPLLPTSHFPLRHTSSGTPLQAVLGRCWHLCPHSHCALSPLHRSCLCSSLKAAQAANMRQLSPPHPSPRPRGSPAPSARDFMTGLSDLLWGGCKGRNSWTTALGKGGPAASSPLSRWKARAPSGGHSTAQQSRQGWLRSCPVHHPRACTHL